MLLFALLISRLKRLLLLEKGNVLYCLNLTVLPTKIPKNLANGNLYL